MTKEQERQFEKMVKDKMQEVKSAGLATGIKTIAAIILEKAKDEKKTETERLKDIISYCEWSLGTINKRG